MGTATTLLALAACSDDEAGERRSSRAGPSPCRPSRPRRPPRPTETRGAGRRRGRSSTCRRTSSTPTSRVRRRVPPGRAAATSARCFTIDRWADLVLASSDTSVAVLSAVPDRRRRPPDVDREDGARPAGSPRRCAATVGCCSRARRSPRSASSTPRSSGMSAAGAATHPIVAWKTYTHIGGGYSFIDDVGAGVPRPGRRARGRRHRPAVVCVHKGFGADPADVGPAAAAHPELTFVVYHSGFEPGELRGRVPRGRRRASTGSCGRCATPASAPAPTSTPSSARRGSLCCGDPDAGRPRARQAARRRRSRAHPVGHRLDLVRLAAGPDRGVPHLRDHARRPRSGSATRRSPPR